MQSIGVYTNNEILDKACEILIHKLDSINSIIEKDEINIKNSENTMANCFDVILENEDYTLGKILEYFLYIKFYESKILTFCGFKKMHPHDTYSIIRLAYKEYVEQSTIKGHLLESIFDAKNIYIKMKKDFLKLMKN